MSTGSTRLSPARTLPASLQATGLHSPPLACTLPSASSSHRRNGVHHAFLSSMHCLDALSATSHHRWEERLTSGPATGSWNLGLHCYHRDSFHAWNVYTWVHVLQALHLCLLEHSGVSWCTWACSACHPRPLTVAWASPWVSVSGVEPSFSACLKVFTGGCTLPYILPT